MRLTWLPVLAFLATPLHAQNPSSPASDSVVIILDRDYDDTLQTSRVTLFKNTIYQLELSREDAQPRFVPVRAKVYLPIALRIRDRGGPIGGPVYEVHIDRDGEYEVGIRGRSSTPVRLRLHTNPSATLNRQVKRDTPRWSIGLRGEYGRHSGYETGALPDSPFGGSTYDACVLIAKGTTASLCVGGGADTRGGEARVNWIFAELRVRVLSLNPAGALPTHFGALGRLANGNAGSAISRDPSFYGLGLYVEQTVARGNGGRGFSFLASAQSGWIKNVTVTGQTSTSFRIGLQWLP
jgi:hypothetical protein